MELIKFIVDENDVQNHLSIAPFAVLLNYSKISHWPLEHVKAALCLQEHTAC